MKKFLALLLSVLMLLTMTAAFAEDGDTGVEGNPPVETEKNPLEFVFTKKYTGAIPMNEELIFLVTFIGNETTGDTTNNPGFLPAEFKLDTDVDAHTNGVYTIKCTIDEPGEDVEYGKYIYMITETVNEEAAPANERVEYDKGAVYVGVGYDSENGLNVSLIQEVKITPRTEDADPPQEGDGKQDQFINKYDVGTFSVTKKLDGNAVNTADKFVVEVTFTNNGKIDLGDLAMTYISSKAAADATPTAVSSVTSLAAGESKTTTITIGADETITFANVPQDLVVSIKETHQDGMGENNLNGYTPSYDISEITIDGTTKAMTITNTRKATLPTGIELDSIPYIVLLAVAVLGAAGFIVKRRMAAVDED